MDDFAVLGSILHSALVKYLFKCQRLTVISVYFRAPITAAIVAVRNRPGMAMRIASILESSRRTLPGRGIVLAADNVDVTDLEHVWWAIATRMCPDRFKAVPGVAANDR